MFNTYTCAILQDGDNVDSYAELEDLVMPGQSLSFYMTICRTQRSSIALYGVSGKIFKGIEKSYVLTSRLSVRYAQKNRYLIFVANFIIPVGPRYLLITFHMR